MKEIPEVQAIWGCGWSGCDRAQLREDVSKVCRAYAVRVLEEEATRYKEDYGHEIGYGLARRALANLADRIKAGKA